MGFIMDKIILIHYINVDHKSPQSVAELVSVLSSKLSKSEEVLNFIYHVKDMPTKVECLNPKLVTGEEYKEAKAILEDHQEIIKKYILVPQITKKYGL